MKQTDVSILWIYEKKRELLAPEFAQVRRLVFHTYKMHFYLLITTWYALTFKLSVEFMKRVFHLCFLLIFYDDMYRWQISPSCLGSRQIILKAGIFSVEDYTRPGRPKTSVTKTDIAAVKIVVEQDARLSVKDIASCTGISEGSVQTIQKKRLDMRKVCPRWVSHLLTDEQKTQRLKCARELLKTYKGCNCRVVSNLLTGDETWVHMFEPQRRADNKQ